MADGKWQFWVDRGGTFTDVIARAPNGATITKKLLSENPGFYGDATVAAMREITGVAAGPLPPSELRIGTTVATNALLEHKGAPTLLAITRGFGDALRIGYQERPELFVREIKVPPPLYADVVEIVERVSAQGNILIPLDESKAKSDFSWEQTKKRIFFGLGSRKRKATESGSPSKSKAPVLRQKSFLDCKN